MPTKGGDITIPDITLHQHLWQRCLEQGSKICLVDNTLDGKSLTFKEIYDQSRLCSAFLHAEGFNVGDFVGLCAGTCLEYAVVMLGIVGCGATVTPCNPGFREGEILQQFRISEPKAVFVHQSAIETMKKVKESLPCLKAIYVIGESDDYTTFASILNRKHNAECLETIKVNPREDIAMLPYSSGTTGLPKSVMLTHQNLVASMIIYEKFSEWNRDGETCGYMDRPLYHGGGFGSLLLSMTVGMKLVMEKEFKVEVMLKAIEKYRVTHMITVPPILIQLVHAEGTEKYDTSSLRMITGGGASMAPDILQRLMEKYNVTMSPAYGMTEAGMISVNNEARHTLTSVGTVGFGVELKIIDFDTTEECPVDKDGEIVVRGPQIMKGYLKNPEANANTIDKDGWLHTGDIGHLDKDGLLYIVDRLKEVIKYKAVQVPPAELESVILKHPKVADVGVIGIPDPEAGEVPKAFVVKKDDSLTAEEVDEFVKSNLVDYKHLRGGVEFVDVIPKSPTGKIQRKELKKMAGLKV